ncbi:hypothetical protein [Flavobacterium sp.]|uniref:hypothetical protein n=1 Tax=Flavobacterium sp. TaxID=239 RepID=UPI0037500054
MKKTISVLSVLFLFICCSKDKENKSSETAEFIGRWKLTQVLSDPGDGSGVYQNVTENKTIEFLTNGTVVANYSLCSDGNVLTAPYFADENYILPNNCFAAGLNIHYQLEGNNLILYYPCIEACSYKFEKLTN